MLLLFIKWTFCQFIPKVPMINSNFSSIIYLNPKDEIEIPVQKNHYTLFSEWSRMFDLKLEVFEYSKDKTIKYGPFDGTFNIGGVFVKKNDYLLKFKNEGDDILKLGLITNENSRYQSETKNYDFPSYIRFPFYDIKSNVYSFKSPIIYLTYQDYSDLILCVPILMLFIIISICCNSKVCCCCHID